MTILTAYLPLGSQTSNRIVGAPKWVLEEDYDFLGNVVDEDRGEWNGRFETHNLMRPNERLQSMLQPMLQKALLERCQLMVHPISAEVAGYALEVTKKGPNRKSLKDWRQDELDPADALRIAYEGAVVPIKPMRSQISSFITRLWQAWQPRCLLGDRLQF